MDIIIFPSTILITAGIICIFITLVEFISKIAILRPIKGKEKYLIIFGFILLVAGCVLAIYYPESTTNQPISALTPVTAPTPTPTPISLPENTTKITFIHPLDSAKVQMKDNIRGTAENIPPGQQLWIGIYPHTALKYYPQKPFEIQNDGTWSFQVEFGEKDNVNEKFDIIAFLANESAQKELNDYINTSITTNTWGKDFLPDGINIITQITVSRE